MCQVFVLAYPKWLVGSDLRIAHVSQTERHCAGPALRDCIISTEDFAKEDWSGCHCAVAICGAGIPCVGFGTFQAGSVSSAHAPTPHSTSTLLSFSVCDLVQLEVHWLHELEHRISANSVKLTAPKSFTGSLHESMV